MRFLTFGEILDDVIQWSSPEALKGFVIQIIGPLIRIIGDRYSWQVKFAILQPME